MNFLDALKSGKRFGRKHWSKASWANIGVPSYSLMVLDLLAEDWETEEPPEVYYAYYRPAGVVKGCFQIWIVAGSVAREIGTSEWRRAPWCDPPKEWKPE